MRDSSKTKAHLLQELEVAAYSRVETLSQHVESQPWCQDTIRSTGVQSAQAFWS